MCKVLKALSVCFIVLLARLLPFSPLVGKWHSMFSWSSLIAPALYNHFGFASLASLFVCNKLWIAPSLILLIRRIPLASLCAARVFFKRDAYISIVLPLFCMGLFIVHPVGNQAWMYSLYWIIPSCLWLVQDNVWTRALQASFVAHAVGSVVWLYSGTMPAEFWIGLIPVVIFERLLMAVGIILCDLILGACMNWGKSFLRSLTVACCENIL